MDDASLDGDDGGLGAVGDPEFREDIGDVKFYGGLRHVQGGCELLVAETGDNVPKNLQFTGGQRVASLAGGEFGGDHRRKIGVARDDMPDGFEDVFDFRGFEHVAGADIDGWIVIGEYEGKPFQVRASRQKLLDLAEKERPTLDAMVAEYEETRPRRR